MAKCLFCKTDVPIWDKKTESYLIGTISKYSETENETHIHGNLEDKDAMKEIIEQAIHHSHLEQVFTKATDSLSGKIKEIVFHNRQRIGDIFMFTCAIRDFKTTYPNIKVSVSSTVMHIWDNNPYIDRLINVREFEAKVAEIEAPLSAEERKKRVLFDLGDGKFYVRIGPGWLTNKSNSLDWHFANAYRCSMEQALGLSIKQGESRPDIWFTQEEFDAPRVDERPYWIIVTGGEKGWGTKMYPTVRWQEVINQNPDIVFYQLGAKNDNHERLVGPNVVDYIGKTEDRNTGLRDLLKLFLNAEGSMGLVSFHMHLSGGLKKPAVVIAGSREPVHFTRYPGHQYIANDGCLPCAETTACWHCDMSACTNLVDYAGKSITLPPSPTQEDKDKVMPKCVDIIKSEDVTRYLRRYYEGGRLKIGAVSKKPKVKIGTPSSVKVELKPEQPVEIDASKLNLYGMSFNGPSLTQRDWEFLCQTIERYNVKSVLEFGAGLSTLLLNDKLTNVVTYEDKQVWIDKIKQLKHSCNIQLWDGKDIPDFVEMFDLSFVDGPANDQPREFSTKIGAEHAKIVMVHDAGREWSRKYQDKYLKDKFQGPFRGGHRCHLWIRNDVVLFKPEEKKEPVKLEINKDIISTNEMFRPTSLATKHVKFVFNGRGEGGAERSATWMMNKLIELGHKVTYHSPNSLPCGTFRKLGSKDVIFAGLDGINEACDSLILYGNDWIWEFDKPEIADLFNSINAQRKLICVNYKIGNIGAIPWTQGWDKYLFLNSSFEKILLDRLPNADTRTMAPPTDLSSLFGIKPNYKNGLNLIRHSSQGDAKFPKSFTDDVRALFMVRPMDLTLRLMPRPSWFLNINDKTYIHAKNEPEIKEYLKLGNCFWYNLPEGYTEGGPKVVMEAQAAGLPVITDNHSGMKDRVAPGTGWLCNKFEDYLTVIKQITPDDLESYGMNAKAHARAEYDPMNWIKEIIG